jgi:glycerophosphoryl diester phosphodiesterase
MPALSTPWPYPRLFAHRGGGTLAPENTLAAMKTGHRQGYHGVEFDVKLSADDVAILMHDPTLERTTDGRGDVKTMRYDQLEKFDAGAWYSPSFAGERIPRFADVAEFLRDNDMVSNVEIKPCPGREAETGAKIALACRELWKQGRTLPLLSSFSFAALQEAQRAAPELPRGLLVKDFADAHWAQLAELEAVSLHCHHGLVAPSLVDALHGKGYRILTYTVNEVSRVAELVSFGVDGIFTDHLDVMRGAFPALIGKTNQAN